MAVGGTFVNDGLNATLKRKYSNDLVTPVTQFKIGTGTTTPAVTDIDIETPITGWNNGSDFGPFTTGYPQFDESSRQVTLRGFIPSAQANGNDITEIGEFNSDTTPIMDTHDVFTAITKTSNVEIAWTSVHQIDAV